MAPRRRSTARRRRRIEWNWPAAAGIALCAVAVILTVALWVLRPPVEPRDPETLCPLAGSGTVTTNPANRETNQPWRDVRPARVTAILVDTTDRVGPISRTDILERLDDLVNSTRTDEMMIAYETSVISEDTGSPLPPLLTVCNPGDPDEASVWTQNPVLVRRQFEEGYRQPLERVFSDLVSLREPAAQSPLMENVQAISVTVLARHAANRQAADPDLRPDAALRAPVALPPSARLRRLRPIRGRRRRAHEPARHRRRHTVRSAAGTPAVRRRPRSCPVLGALDRRPGRTTGTGLENRRPELMEGRSAAEGRWLASPGATFLAFAAGGGCSILVLKALVANQFIVTAAPCGLMVVYAWLLWDSVEQRPRSEAAGDNLYYLGFLYTLTSLAHSLYQFNANEGDTQAIVTNFGIAIFTTILGMTAARRLWPGDRGRSIDDGSRRTGESGCGRPGATRRDALHSGRVQGVQDQGADGPEVDFSSGVSLKQVCNSTSVTLRHSRPQKPGVSASRRPPATSVKSGQTTREVGALRR